MRLILPLLILLRVGFAYLQIPLAAVSSNHSTLYAIQLGHGKDQCQLVITLDPAPQYIPVQITNKSRNKTNLNSKATLECVSLEDNNNVEGWRRYWTQALFFISHKYHHSLQLSLEWMEHKANESYGLISLSPSPSSNRFFSEIQNSYPHITEKVFAIYMGAGDKSSIQLGGYEQNYAYQTDSGQFHRVELANSSTEWVIEVEKLGLSKDDRGRYVDFVLGQQMTLKLSLDHNKLLLLPSVVKVLLLALESENISCQMQGTLHCQNMTSLDLSLHVLSFQVSKQFSVNVSLFRLLKECDKKMERCEFDVRTGDRFQIGQSFFKDHYTVFDMDQKHILVGVSNKYPGEWFSTVYLVRIGLGLLLMMIITAFFVQSPNYAKYLRYKKDDVQSIQLVSRDLSVNALTDPDHASRFD